MLWRRMGSCRPQGTDAPGRRLPASRLGVERSLAQHRRHSGTQLDTKTTGVRPTVADAADTAAQAIHHPERDRLSTPRANRKPAQTKRDVSSLTSPVKQVRGDQNARNRNRAGTLLSRLLPPRTPPYQAAASPIRSPIPVRSPESSVAFFALSSAAIASV